MPRQLLAAQPVTVDPFDPSKLDGITKFCAAGFTAAAALLTFFGIKDGYLDRVLSENAQAALWVFLLIGLGVVASLLAAAVSKDYQVASSLVVLVIVLLGTLQRYMLPHLSSHNTLPTALLWGLVVAGAIVAYLGYLFDILVSLGAALVVVAVAATSMGLYGAVKLSVEARAQHGVLQVTAQLGGQSGAQTVDVGVKGSRQDRYAGTVQVLGRRAGTRTGDVSLGVAQFSPDDSGNVDHTFSFPVVAADWDELLARYCVGNDCRQQDVTTITTAQAATAVIGASLVPAADKQQAHLDISVNRLRRDGRVVVTITKDAGGHENPVLTSTLVAGNDGTASMSGDLPTTKGEHVVIRALVCDPDCQGTPQIVAELHQ